MIIYYGSNEDYYKSHQTVDSLSFKVVHIAAPFNLGIVCTGTVEHDKTKTGKQNNACQEIIVVIITGKRQQMSALSGSGSSNICLCHRNCLSSY